MTPQTENIRETGVFFTRNVTERQVSSEAPGVIRDGQLVGVTV